MRSTFAVNLRSKRKENGFSQQRLANKLKIPVKNYRNYEGGVTEPKLDLIVKISYILQTSTDYLLKNTIPRNLVTPN